MMTPTEMIERQRSINPIWPWTWEAWYRDGGRLWQFDAGCRRRPAEIDLERVVALAATKPGATHRIQPKGRPDGVVIMARVSLINSGQAALIDRWFTFRYGDRISGIAIDDDGRVRPVEEQPFSA